MASLMLKYRALRVRGVLFGGWTDECIFLGSNHREAWQDLEDAMHDLPELFIGLNVRVVSSVGSPMTVHGRTPARIVITRRALGDDPIPGWVWMLGYKEPSSKVILIERSPWSLQFYLRAGSDPAGGALV